MIEIPVEIKFRVGDTVQVLPYPAYGTIQEVTDYIRLVRELGIIKT